MSSLREIKDRISSVKSTLKITSAMKLVASSKLRKAQKAIENLRPYERALQEILGSVGSAPLSLPADDGGDVVSPRTAMVLISSNSSLCGGFNANVIRKALEVASGCGGLDVYAIGRKGADAMRKAGVNLAGEYPELIAHPSYREASGLAASLSESYRSGFCGRVLLVYNHFVTTSRQEVVVEQYLPLPDAGNSSWNDDSSRARDYYIVEPDPAAVVAELMPQVLSLKFYAAVLDSAAAEHAARTVAMQTATDNAQDLLGDLTLEYNKGRQQKITSEILDLLGGSGD